jgi:hypothetical protein
MPCVSIEGAMSAFLRDIKSLSSAESLTTSPTEDLGLK